MKTAGARLGHHFSGHGHLPTTGAVRHSRVLAQKQQFFYSPYRPPPTWNALRNIEVGHKKTQEDVSTLDATLDLVGYQLFRDGLLPKTHVSGRQLPSLSDQELSPAVRRRLQKERDAAVALMKKHGVVVRRSIKETAITIGCDEAGRGPLAGPVVGAAVSRIPMSSFNNEFEGLYETAEQFQIFDSKSVSESQRKVVFGMVTGHASFSDVVRHKQFQVHHCGTESTPENTCTTLKRIPTHAKLAATSFKRLTHARTPHLISYHGYNAAGNYLYFWSIAIANHAYIDQSNIYAASMQSMHRSALSVWHMMNDARFSLDKAPRPKGSTVAQYLFTRFCTAANHDHEKRYKVPAYLDLMNGAADFFDFEPVQPPLVLVDGHAVPDASYTYFTDAAIGGEVQPIIEGDKRSLSIAAASCLAKVCRDEIMTSLGQLYPAYRFAENKGYPVEDHMKLITRHGLCPVHRKTFRPCKAVLEREERRRERMRRRESNS